MSDSENSKIVSLDMHFKPIVLVTGFGPFEGHEVNASWEAVKLLCARELETRHKIELVTLELPVTYESVDEFVPELWQTHEPKVISCCRFIASSADMYVLCISCIKLAYFQLVIHVGVSRLAEQLTIETTAHRKGYSRRDYLSCCPDNHCCGSDGASRLKTRLNVEQICLGVNERCEGIKAVSSCDAGRYLCEYIYYKSLSINDERVVFVHVPDITKSPSEQTARGIEHVIDLCLEEIEAKTNCV